MNTITISVGWFIVLICSNVFVLLAVSIILYFLAGIHDLFFVKYHKHKDNNCPYEVEDKDDEH